MNRFAHPRLAATLAAAALCLPMLQGCFPLIAGGVAAGALSIDDRRTLAIQAEDKTIFAKAETRLGEKFGDKAHINVTSFNRRVLLTGEVADDKARAEAERIVGGVENVSTIVNELQVAGISSITGRTNDSIITSKVKGNFVDDPNISANAFKVVTESGVVYLMGLVTRAEADRAAAVAARTSGVKQVVKVFDYVPVAPKSAAAADTKK
jgi:osmotically-inducible protein OsmY